MVLFLLCIPKLSTAVTVGGIEFSDTETFSVSTLDLHNSGGVIGTINNPYYRVAAADRQLGEFTESISGIDFTVTAISIVGGFYSSGVANSPNPENFHSDFKNQKLYAEFNSGVRPYYPGSVEIVGILDGVEQVLFSGILRGRFLMRDWATDCPPGMPYEMVGPNDNYGFYTFDSYIELNGGALAETFGATLGFSGDFAAWLNTGKGFHFNAVVGKAVFHRLGHSSPPPENEIPEPNTILLFSSALVLGRRLRGKHVSCSRA